MFLFNSVFFPVAAVSYWCRQLGTPITTATGFFLETRHFSRRRLWRSVYGRSIIVGIGAERKFSPFLYKENVCKRLVRTKPSDLSYDHRSFCPCRSGIFSPNLESASHQPRGIYPERERHLRFDDCLFVFLKTDENETFNERSLSVINKPDQLLF
jgi:hypothetical protein